MTRQYDAIVIGAGVSGLYALYKLRELGLSARVFEAGTDIGSTNPENVRGRFLLFAGGVPLYREIFAEVAAKGYEGFELS